jgi:diguanylate cyclase (GGDEF)-like protein
METKRKVITTVSLIMVGTFLIMLIIISKNLRDLSFESTYGKAELVAQSVKNGLTAHMVNGMMPNRGVFIKETKNLNNIDNIWIVRSKTVEKQYGKVDVVLRDEIDEKVLQNGESVALVNENIFGHSNYRITIPYKAENTENIKCLDCHEAKLGDTLGVISMVIAMDDLKITSLKIIGWTFALSVLLILFIILFVNRLITPYLSIFQSIKTVMKKANSGDYTGRIDDIKTGEAKDVAHWINEHMERLQTSFKNIGDKIDIFLNAHNNDKVQDPMVEVQTTVNRLADLYKFRKTIEHDETIDEVYNRFATVLEDRFGVYDFNFIEADTTNKTTDVVYTHKKLICDPISDGCRADRTNTAIYSCQFSNVCDKISENNLYICIPYSISNDLDFIVSMIVPSQEEYDRVRELLPFIQDYVDAAKPEIVSKKLMQILERNAQTDPLTGLYNRKYLEHYLDKQLYSGINQDKPCGLMMVDIDHFKQINDNYGHDIGDIAIKTIANTLIDVVSPTDVIVRFGGEEFIVVLTDSNEEDLQQVAEEIRIAFSQQKIQSGVETFSKTISIGTALFPNKSRDFWKYVKQADIALYEAKQTGRNKVIRYKEGME